MRSSQNAVVAVALVIFGYPFLLTSLAQTAPSGPGGESPVPAAALKTLREEYDKESEAAENEVRPLLDAARGKYIRDLGDLQIRLLNGKKVRESSAVGDELKRVKENRDENESVKSLPVETKSLRLQYEQDLAKAGSGAELKLHSIKARYAEKLAAATRVAAASGRPTDVEVLRFERAMVQVSDLIAQKRVVKTALVGDNPGGGLDETPKRGAILAGYHVGEGGYNSEKIIKSIQPVFRSSSGDFDGEVHGEGPRGSDVIAKPGYAVGAVLVKPGDRLIGLQVTFMKIKADGMSLDPQDSYKSDWQGGSAGGRPKELNGGGHLVIGSIIRSGSDADALGLVYLQ